ncbi:MAG: chlorite dismutase family protein [Actinomycetota bacterium]|nr:chlorite dismutase family protein [Actinomycetota bacterium]
MTDEDQRKLMRYVFYKVDPAWRALPAEDRSLHKKELAAVVADASCEVYPYSTVGLRGDVDFGLWQIADSTEGHQSLQAAINGTQLGARLEVAYSYLAMTRKSQYLKGHKHEGQEFELPISPKGNKYLFVYPMDKKREWYRLDFEARRKVMGEHFRVGHKYPNVTIHTGYSFGIDDQEFVVAFEGESLGEFLDLVEELRGSESSSFTARDVPIFTCVKTPLEKILDQLDGTNPSA